MFDGNRIKMLILKNAMLFVNLMANLVGWFMVAALILIMVPLANLHSLEMVGKTSVVFFSGALVAGCLFTWLYERPIRRVFNLLAEKTEPGPQEWLVARRRILNQPYFFAVMNMFIWLSAAAVYSAVLTQVSEGRALIPGIVYRSLVTGLTTVVAGFFITEHAIQHRLAPVLFPRGGLSDIPGALRVRVLTRLAALILAGSVVPLMAILVTVHSSRRVLLSGASPAEMLSRLQVGIAGEALLFILVAVTLAGLVALNMVRPLNEMTRVLSKVRRGEFEHRVEVMSSDEIGFVGDQVNHMVEGLAERERIKETFGRYVSPEVAREILAGRASTDGEVREVTVLFADLVGFTPLAARVPAKRVVETLNLYFAAMTQAVEDAGGLILGFLGDGFMAVFGAPLPTSDHAGRALAAAVGMNLRLDEVNAELTRRGWEPVNHGVGIHSGPAVAANIGSPRRLSYTLVGETVNLASRLEGLTRELGARVVVSGETRSRLESKYDLRPLPMARVKGLETTVEVWALD